MTAELERLGVPYELVIASAHRTPDKVHQWAETAADRGLKVIIAAAGKAAHLGGVVAAFTPLPVVGVPMKTSDLGGMDSLLSMVQMPSGVPVACVAINGAKTQLFTLPRFLALLFQSIARRSSSLKPRWQTHKLRVPARTQLANKARTRTHLHTRPALQEI